MEIAMSSQMEKGDRQVQGGYRHVCASVLATYDAFEGLNILTHMILLHKHLMPLWEQPTNWGTAVSLTCDDSLRVNVVLP